MQNTTGLSILSLALAIALRGDDPTVLETTYDRLIEAGQDELAEALGTVEPADNTPAYAAEVLMNILRDELDDHLSPLSGRD